VPEGGNEGVEEELQYVDVAQDLDPSPAGPKANLASEGKPRIINPGRRSWIETLDAWSLGTYCDRTAQNNSVLSPKPVHMAIKQ
jgi:hypothetical protein